MTPLSLPAILENEELRQAEFPVARDQVFLAHAAVCPLPQRVRTAIADYARSATLGDQEEAFETRVLDGIRTLAASLLNVDPDEVACVGPTSLALSFIAHGFPWSPGDEVLVYPDDYPSNVYPWMALADRGVTVRHLRTPAPGRIEPDAVLEQLSPATRLVALASCHFTSGYRLDHVTLGQALQERGVAFCLDAIQTLGAAPTPANTVDFAAADAHKWLLGPCAAGVLVVRKHHQLSLRPIAQGWNNVECPLFVAQEELRYRTGARRFEAGTHNLLGLVGLHAALRLLHEIGPSNITRRLRAQREHLIPRLTDIGWSVLHADAPPDRSAGIVTLEHPSLPVPRIHQALRERNIIVSLRYTRTKQPLLRISPHFYNTDAELDRFVDELHKLSQDS